jgi:hypothetical protein
LVTNFYGVFQGCVKLTEIPEIFCALGEEGTRFLGKTVNMSYAFNISSFSGTIGTAPDLWNYAGTFTKTSCWTGHGVLTLNNWGDIPVAWR